MNHPHQTPRLSIGRPAAVLLLLLLVALVLAAPARPARAAFPGLNGRIAFTTNRDGADEIYIMNADGGGQTRLTNNSAQDRDPAWSPDGTKIAFTSYRDGNLEVYVMNADGSSPTNLTNNTASDFEPAWSPDGTQIAFTSARDGNLEIYVMDADGSGPTNMTDFALHNDFQPTWSPDGTQIAFTSNRDGDSEVYVMQPNGSGPTNVTNNLADDVTPNWSPDGTQIAFSSNREGQQEIYVMDADGSGPTNLTNSSAADNHPAWSPDGTLIAFASYRDSQYEIYVMNADGTTPANRTGNPATDYEPDWEADVPSLTITKYTDPAGGAGFPFTLDPGPYTFQFKWGVLNAFPNPPPGTFDEPNGVAVYDDNVYVADTDNDRVQQFDAAGNFIRQWGETGSGNGQFSLPWGIAVDGAGRVYVADTENNRIQRFSAGGVYQTQWGNSGGGAGQFNRPFALAVAPDGSVYVADTDNFRIQKFSAAGAFLLAFGQNVDPGGGAGFEICVAPGPCQPGTAGSGNGHFDRPTGVAVDAAGDVYVVDYQNHRVQKFDAGGAYLDQWGANGGGDGEFSYPFGIAADAGGSVYVSELGSARVQKFDSDGAFLTKWGTPGSGDGQFNNVRGLAVHASGDVYTADTFNDRIQVFSPTKRVTLDHQDSHQWFLTPGTYRLAELVPDGWTLSSFGCDGGAPVYDNPTITLTLDPGEDVNCSFTNTFAPPAAPDFYVSATTAGTTADGLDFGSEDILKWDGAGWSMVFDGSEAGLTARRAVHNINAFWLPETGDEVLIAFSQNRRDVAGIPFPVDGMDIVHWNGAAFSFHFDGSDVGLTNKTQEKIDGLHVLPGDAAPYELAAAAGGPCQSYLLISTAGPGKVPNYSGGALNFSGEDVLGFCATQLGTTTAGKWIMVLDGSARGMPRNSTDSISVKVNDDDSYTLYLTTRGAFHVGDAHGGHSAVYAYDSATQAFSGPLFSAPAAGLPAKVDGLQYDVTP